jgi:hypothetical protein
MYDSGDFTTRIVDTNTNQTIKTYKNFKLFAFSKDNKFIFGFKKDEEENNILVRINLENDEQVNFDLELKWRSKY